MNAPEIITKQEVVQEPENEISLQQWLFDRVKDYVTGRVLEISVGEGIIAPVCERNGIRAEVKRIDLSDDDFEEKYMESVGLYDTIIVLNAGEDMKRDKNMVLNTTLLIKEGGHLITRLPVQTALFNGLDQGFKYWKRYNLEYINKVLRKHYSVIKTRYLQVASKESITPRNSKYSERISIIKMTELTVFIETGLSMIIVGRKR